MDKYDIPRSFNTQPPEGGWGQMIFPSATLSCFNTQPPEGGWLFQEYGADLYSSFNTQPPEGGWTRRCCINTANIHSFNTQPPEGGWDSLMLGAPSLLEFQHTAARRRLVSISVPVIACGCVSTHSRPKAAGFVSSFYPTIYSSFNTQPPEGGWLL